MSRLSHVAERHGLGEVLSSLIQSNKSGSCECTESECEMLSRMVDDERVSRAEVPKILGKSYRECNNDDDFDKIRKLRRVGIYSKVSTLIKKYLNK